MSQDSLGNIQIDGSAEPVPPSASPQSVIVRAEKVMLQVAAQAEESHLDPKAMLRVLVILAAPVHDPRSPDRPPTPLDLHQEWHVLAGEVRKSLSPILLARLVPPTLESLRFALSPRVWQQKVFPRILHFSGHAWKEGLLLKIRWVRSTASVPLR